MAPRQLSNTLPKNFVFSALDEPTTPERPSTSIDVPPPLTRHSFSSGRLRINRVRAGTDVCARMELDRDLFRLPVSPDIPLPSIEAPPSPLNLGPVVSDDTISDGRFLAPPHRRMECVTPPAQTELVESCDTGNAWPSWDQSPLTITRSGSSCSNDSDSSIESIDTLTSRPSVGSFTSDEGDHTEPKESKAGSAASPNKQKVERTHFKHKAWSQEMDNHLWNTYQMYLSDPTVTPFKMTPGAVPPLGVTTRVARVAKLNWQKNMRSTQAAPSPRTGSTGSTIKGPQTSRGPRTVKPVWPKSNRKIRQRLKLLCVRKFSITPHYHRMMQSRSPEPAPHGIPSSSGAYSTRDLGVSLATPHEAIRLTQLAEETEETGSHWKEESYSNHSHGTSHGTSRVELSSIPPRLGSPFAPSSTWSPASSSRRVDGIPRSARRQTFHVPARRLRRTTHLNMMTPRDQDEGFPLKSSVDIDPSDEEIRRRLSNYVQGNQLQDIGNGRVRIRSRGATMGAVGPRDVSQLFSPPYSSANEEETTPVAKLVNPLLDPAKGIEETTPATILFNPLLNLDGEAIKRLGSPFKADGDSQRQAPRRFIRHAPSSSDPSFGGMLNPFEEGISDAERIRRQILQQKN
ncbi:hypothetical protein N7495_001545 [Penicillium taxi]|uniref:uncharacterized protein n=1 Tax=Penicillium taxi TaxID=168475 RepID=UPI002545A65F|nr:uncharacterized protein N7495_001545 [Penicillium taxi]KAJ5908863.1 hypothetical protein N7495_001545 [Penicillium taxi]